MNKKWKAKWVAALRGGEYQQGQGQLAISLWNKDRELKTSFCCLGVLCSIHPDVQEKIVEVLSAAHKHHEFFYEDSNESACVGSLPNGLRNKLGINTADEEYLINMNDGGGPDSHVYASFNEIADYIEEKM